VSRLPHPAHVRQFALAQRLVGIAAVGWCRESRYLIDTTTTRLARKRTP
jgi:hypothetical protein